MKFSIITVCLNPGEKLKKTLDSVLRQSYGDAEVILKDGGSEDGSVIKWRKENEKNPEAERVRIFVEKDTGIYDAMNQAVTHAKGEFVLFLNCGDVFPDEEVLERTRKVIEAERAAGTDMERLVLYGDTCSGKNHVCIASPPAITGFTCYRNIPCHQSCFYSAALCREKPYDLQYKIRADYDHFLWCFYRAGAKMRHMDFTVAFYEGGGYSESRENRARDKQEHRQITEAYMDRGELLKYRGAMAASLAPVRRFLAESSAFSGGYHWLKERLYHRKWQFLAAFIVFLLEMALLVWPGRWLREETGILSPGRVFKAFALCGLTAFGIAAGLPENRRFRNCVGILLFVLGPLILGRRLELLTLDTGYLLPFSMRWNMGIMYLFGVILLLCTGSIRFSVCGGNLLLTLLYTVNYYVFSFRGGPLHLNDLTAAGTAARVVGNYNLRPNSHLAFVWCILGVFLVYGAQSGLRRKRDRAGKRRAFLCHLASLAAGIALAGVSGYWLLNTDMLVEAGFTDIRGFDETINYHFNGYLVASFIDIRNSRVVKPQGYREETVEAILEEARDSTVDREKEEMPHIILIMNESFSDLRVLGDLQPDEENLPFFYGLSENTVRGYVNASVLGGGTANSEFEVFTGCSMGFLPVSYYAYQRCVRGEMPSLVSSLNHMGYTTWSMHPAPASNWNRERVYRSFGFGNSLWIEDFPEADSLHYGVSDLETYRKVEELFESREAGERLFVFDLTIQNHGGYYESDVERSVTASNLSSAEADIYLSLMRESDRAFGQLIDYFSLQEEPVVVCMFGDHQPKLPDDFYEELYAQTPDMDETEKQLNIYKTPFVIWANYDIQERADLDIGMSYLGALLMDVAGLPKSPFFSFLSHYMEEYPIVTMNGYGDREGNFHGWSGDGSELAEYRMLQYNYLFEQDRVAWGF